MPSPRDMRANGARLPVVGHHEAAGDAASGVLARDDDDPVPSGAGRHAPKKSEAPSTDPAISSGLRALDAVLRRVKARYPA